VETAVKFFGAVDAEEVAVAASAADFWSADGFVRVFAGWRQKNHAPARHSRHDNKINQRERINFKWQTIVSQYRHNARMQNRRSEIEDGSSGRGAATLHPFPSSWERRRPAGPVHCGVQFHPPTRRRRSQGGCAPHPQSSVFHLCFHFHLCFQPSAFPARHSLGDGGSLQPFLPAIALTTAGAFSLSCPP
jgi:hypothetical protein